jgi:hypothetical protein
MLIANAISLMRNRYFISLDERPIERLRWRLVV